MHCVVKIPELNTIFCVAELDEIPEARDGVVIEPGAWVDSSPSLAEWPIGEDRPPPRTLGVSKVDPKFYKEFKYPGDLEKEGFEPTGMMFGGYYSPTQWEQMAEKIPAMKAFDAIQGNDLPGAMDEAMRYIREAR